MVDYKLSRVFCGVQMIFGLWVYAITMNELKYFQELWGIPVIIWQNDINCCGSDYPQQKLSIITKILSC